MPGWVLCTGACSQLSNTELRYTPPSPTPTSYRRTCPSSLPDSPIIFITLECRQIFSALELELFPVFTLLIRNQMCPLEQDTVSRFLHCLLKETSQKRQSGNQTCRNNMENYLPTLRTLGLPWLSFRFKQSQVLRIFLIAVMFLKAPLSPSTRLDGFLLLTLKLRNWHKTVKPRL